ncbi:MAG TPA: hypothetical protein PLP25_02765 [Candidatus Limiplasma sp.]|nr:hypothetical protein [Candidatus Limiplasma sp.]HPS80769.1 hypothetical protein [Candidatus Limiplasma sp.]
MTRFRSLPRRTLAWLCALLLLLSVLPLYALALYNHSFYDDLGFSLLTRAAWQQTGSLAAVLEAAVRNTVGIRQTWEGTYTTSFLSALQPSVFGEGAYWITTFLLLTCFLLAVGYFLRQTLSGLYGMDRTTVVTAYGILGFVLVQFVPDAAEAFYWYNGGVAYTLLWSVMLLEAGVWLAFERASGKARNVWLFGLLVALTVLVGGAKYSTVLFAALLAVCFTVWAFWHRRPKRWAYLLLTLLLLGCFAFSAMAAGNSVRAKTLGGGLSAPKAVLEALYFGVALIGHSFSLPLLAALILLVPLSAPALRQSSFRFAHPVWVTGLAVALFCAQLAPTLYTGNYLGDGRVLDTYHYTWVLTAAQLVLYWTGWFLRRGERGLAPADSAPEPPTERPEMPLTDGESAPAVPDALFSGGNVLLTENRLKAATLALVAGMLLMGCLAYHPDGSQSYGPQNMAGGSALRSVLSGEAAAFSAAMDARDAELNDPALQDVELIPVEGAPANLMGDALSGDNLDYVLRLYTEYYNKATVSVAETEGRHAP